MLTRQITSDEGPFESAGYSEPAFVALREANQAFDALAALVFSSVAAGGEDSPFQTTAMAATAGIWDVLGVQPVIGRSFGAADDRPGAPPVALISHRLWSGRYGNEPGVLGQSLVVGRTDYAIIGILPRGFSFVNEATDIWIPLAIDPGDWADNAAVNNNRIIAGRVSLATAAGQTDGIEETQRAAIEISPEAFASMEEQRGVPRPRRTTCRGRSEICSRPTAQGHHS